MTLVPLPYRLAGYGAYNLCFDTLLGRRHNNPADPDFFATLFNDGFRKINLVKVICFRWSQNEMLPASRAVPLYINGPAGPAINQAFLENLATLVGRAAESRFWVEVCIFHQQAIANPNGPPNDPNARQELPENLPPELMPQGDTPCKRLRNFYNPRPANPAQLARQKELVNAIVNRLKGYTNVLYELGNELRIEGGDCSFADNCALAEWLNIMGNQILNVLGQTNSIGTSTGTYADPSTPTANESSIFNGCTQHFSPGYFDFHFGQWYDKNNLSGGMAYAKQRADGYKGRPTPLIINDDGARGAQTAPNVELWAGTAFKLGAQNIPLHYLTKQKYPNGAIDADTGQLFDFDFDVLTRLNRLAGI